MEFLVHIDVEFPSDVDPETKSQLIAAERQRAIELAEQGVVKRLWRVPGRWANWGVWEAPDATALHEAVSSLPLFAYLDVEVFPLAQHPSDPARGS